ncbi:hypothetical protein ABGB14_22990 [Nonomuraea sp. B10E15]|uniref:hypothetical protein n=1 Tax=Nonomuraea sp. B10E15 TaxID=3153560 RepID=UPI00325E4E3E
MAVTGEDGRRDSVEITYASAPFAETTVKAVPAISAGPATPEVEAVFIPAKVVRELGLQLDTEALIVDPSLHRVSEADRDRLQDRLGDSAEVYLEQGYQASSRWLYVAGTMALIALAGALVATIRSNRSHLLLRRVGGGSGFAVRGLVACRAALAAACGTVTGASAGCAIGLLLAWPFTASPSWDALPRVSFGTPWTSIGLLTVAIPLLAAAVTLLVKPSPGMTTGS